METSEILAGYLNGVAGLASFLALPDEVLYGAPVPGAWSAAEVIHHLADAEIVTADRLRRILVQDGPDLPDWDQFAYCQRLGYGQRPVLESVAVVTALRRANVELLSSLGNGQWQRSGTHPVTGRLTLLTLVVDSVAHFDEHLAQARRAVNGGA